MIGSPATRSGPRHAPVVLRPGRSAHADVHTRNQGVSDEPCRPSADRMQVYPPGSTSALRLPARSFQVCGGTFEVTSLEPGSGP